MTNKNIKNKAFTIIEVIVACSIISISMFALMQTAQKGLYLSHQSLKKSQASFLIEEGVEAVKSIRDNENNEWTYLSNLTLGANYYLFFNTNTKLWELNNTSTTSLSGYIPTYPIDGVFNRTVVVNSVGRDVNDDILATGGTIDPRTKKVTVIVSWTTGGVASSKELSFYITDIFN